MNPLNGSLKEKTSFYYPLLLLPSKKRRAMEVLYRFCWEADEISDGPGAPAEKSRRLSRFRQNLRAAFQNRAEEILFQKLQTLIPSFGLSREPLERILEGVKTDLKPVRFKKFAQLHRYALQVAGGPGLASMEIFGFKDKPHRDYAENLGVFLQIVNMVRDYREDRAIGRQYFPSEDYRLFHLNPRAMGEENSRWMPFVDFQLNRAWSFLEKARRSLSPRQRGFLTTAEAISAVYGKLYQKLKDHPDQILKGKISLSKTDKLVSVAGAAFQCGLWRWTAR